jgi:hypothetical protein
MDALEQGGLCLSIWLDTDHYVFVQRFVAAGVFASPDEMIATALDALARPIEASARRAATAHGSLAAEEAGLEQLADMLDAPAAWQQN